MIRYLRNTGLILLCLISVKIYGQETISFGLSGVYNFPLKTIAAGFRANVPLGERLAVSPQVKYAPKFNDIHEIMAGANLHYNLITNVRRRGDELISEPRKPIVYLAAGVLYNRWINYTPSLNAKAKANNVLPEAGLGMAAGGNILRVFAEGKYNILWNESYGEIGVLIYPYNKRSSKALRCP